MKVTAFVSLGAIADIQLGKMLSPRSKHGSNSYPYLRNQNVQWDFIDLKDVATMNFDDDEQQKFLLKSGDLLVCEGGEPGRAAIWRGEMEVCHYQKALHRVRPKQGFHSEYLMFALWYLSNHGAFADLNSKTTIAHLPLVRLKTVQIPAITSEEQIDLVQRLRSQLSRVRQAIEEASAQVSLAGGKTATALLAEHFGTRPAIVTEASNARGKPGWRVHSLLDLARLESGHTPSRRRVEWWGGDVPWLALPDIRKVHGKHVYETTEYTNDAGLTNSSARLLPAGTVCLSRTASVGFVTILGKPMATSQDFANWICDLDKLDPEFLMYAFMASQNSLRELGSGAVHRTIYMPAIESFHVCAPEIGEQRRIASTMRQQLVAVEALTEGLRARLIEIERLPQRLLEAAFRQLG